MTNATKFLVMIIIGNSSP
ncbi:BnaC04g19310D [Brassica napus]|uniref:BnaC04g19310D protein n=1 Tax=Brassica napus TaxID=3708 RepID=A0A078F6A0_BRANA|nr:BnaC04g19310D [Brassica napus]